ncbi:helix-turn-helix domain-containing protein [Streptomyces lasiicapitis]|uniref:HTH cro/C1-type domain-containing protein n=1 Tax=Streptomyces lasiicapitis TaxID=1923961 RepID=A0ABQ2MU54_9ACTN|nr:helix-turn-helix transcriptional regulator [Streptomyces lasiicapitis]GGO58854.1 hypothetical protein GCM10012286_79110 [Streptomyces lasiicapitis]
MAEFARELRELQQRSGISARDTHAATGIPVSTIYAATSGTRLPTADVVSALAQAWGDEPARWLRQREQAAARREGRNATDPKPPSALVRQSEPGQPGGALRDLDARADLAFRLQELHEKSGRSLRALSATAGLDTASVSRAFSGITVPTWESMQAMLRALGAPQDLAPWRTAWGRAREEQARRAPSALRTETIKLLFASATSCAAPDCAEPLMRWSEGRPIVAADIVHISADSRLEISDRFENLLLLCPNHRRLVSSPGSPYTIADLKQWKTAQVAQSGQALTDPSDDIAHQVSQTLRIFTELDITVELIGGQETGNHGIAAHALAQLATAAPADSDPEVYLGVRVSNHGRQAMTVAGVGVDFKLGSKETQYASYNFPYALPVGEGIWRQPSAKLAPQSHGVWFAPASAIAVGVQILMERTGRTPQQIRPYANNGPSNVQHGPWRPFEEIQQALVAPLQVKEQG